MLSGETQEKTGAWEREFFDDLVAANRFKTFLVSQGIELDETVLGGLAHLSVKFKDEIDAFVSLERENWVLRAPLKWFARRPK